MNKVDFMIEIQLQFGNAVGIKVSMPEAPPLIIVRGQKGVLFCGYLNPEVAEKLGLVAAIVTGANTFDEILEKPLVYSTKKAQALGIVSGMSGREAISLLV